jgi:peptidoglycan hydrolase-like protein with peptidoglycan-binding domain
VPNGANSQGFIDKLEKGFKDAVGSVEGAIDGVTKGKEDVERVEKKATDLEDDLTGSGEDKPRYDKPWIAEIQAHLATLGYNPGPADGVLGKGTQNAIRAYQSQNSLVANGAPTPSLMASLRKARQQAKHQAPTTSKNITQGKHNTQPHGQAIGTPASQQSSQSDLSSLHKRSPVELTFETQDRLNQLGYNAGAPDGQYGNKTKTAIIAYQKHHGMPATGKVTPELVASLRQAQGNPTVAAGPTTTSASGSMGGPLQTNQSASSTKNILPGPAGPGLVATKPVIQGGRLLTGYPINRGHHSSKTVQFLERESNRSHVELARYLDLVILKSDPKVLDRQDTAYRYARRFLTKSSQQQFLSPCQTPRCMHGVSGVPFGGWIGGNEFQREKSYRNFLQAKRSKLMAMAPPSPAGLLQVMEVELGAYDTAENSFPLRILRNQTVLVGIQTAYGLKWDYDFTLPVSIPVSREKAEAFVGQFPKRKAFLALAQSVTEIKPYRFGNALSARMKLDHAALYTDQNLQHKAYDFGLHVADENIVGVAAAGGSTE